MTTKTVKHKKKKKKKTAETSIMKKSRSKVEVLRPEV